MNFISRKKSIKATILFLFGLTTFILLFVLGIQLIYMDNKLVEKDINAHISNIVSDINLSIEDVEQLGFTTIEMLGFASKKSESQKKENFKIYIDTLKLQKKFYSIYTGYSDGSFYEVINLDVNENIRKTYNAKDIDKWLIINIDGKNSKKEEQYFYDENLNEISKKFTLENTYNPTKRSWYKEAIENGGKSIRTTPYQFASFTFENAEIFGISYVKQLDGTKNVIAIDFLLDDLKDLLKNNIDEDTMDVFLFRNNTKQVTASVSKDEKLFKEFLKSYENISYFNELRVAKINNKKYFVQIAHVNSFVIKDQYLILFSDYDKIVAPYYMQTFKQIGILLIICLLMIPVILYFSKIITKPIFALLNESKKIKNRDYVNVVKIDSSILEVSLLSNSFFDMSKSIYEYQHQLEQKIEDRTKELSLKNEELFKLSITDRLTKLYNRMKLDNALQESIDKSLRYNNIFSVIIIDIDFFKSVNDNFGHQVGDDVLKESSKILKNSVRSVDILGRWGGEEFLIICPETPLSGAKELALKINKTIKEYKFSTYPNSVTMSMGCACYKQGVLTYDEIILNADKALYLAKENGRDRVEVFKDKQV